MFLDIPFPLAVAGGVSGGPERRVDIVKLASGAEERNARWVHSRRSFDASVGVRDADDLASVLAFFEETGGPLHSFRFKDWSDFSSASSAGGTPSATDQVLGAGDGVRTAFQLVKTYGGLLPYARDITKPVAGSVVIALDGVPQATGWSVDPLAGLVTFSAPPGPGVQVSAGFHFDVPVRFDTQQLFVDMAFFSEAETRGVGQVPEIPLIEVRE